MIAPYAATVRGETVTVLGPTPDDWTGLGQANTNDAMLVRYPDGEIGSVPKPMIEPLKTEAL